MPSSLRALLLLAAFAGRAAAAPRPGVRTIVASPDGRVLASVDSSAIHLWDVAEARERATLRPSAAAVTAVSFSPDGRRLVSISGGVLHLWSVATGLEEFPLGRDVHARSAAVSPDGALLALVDADGVSIRELATGRESLRLPPQSGASTTVAFASGGRLLAIGGSDRIVRLWDVEGRRLRAELIPLKARGY